ncbi:MAG: hypothetical protein LPJ91_01725 [Pseudazoarcus pumilus]|nr:hypothetical protein [Pseudazoarcus pumilus]
MRLTVTACAALLLTACLHAPQKQSEGGSETFAMPSQTAETTAATEAPPPAGTRTPVWAAIPDLMIPGWEVKVTQVDEQRFRLRLRMRPLLTGGDGEARTAFLRSAREIVDAGGYAGYDVLRYEESIDSGMFFARRGASGEIRVVQSQSWGM